MPLVTLAHARRRSCSWPAYQGSGKTTSSAKLARLLASKGRKPMLVACDL